MPTRVCDERHERTEVHARLLRHRFGDVGVWRAADRQMDRQCRPDRTLDLLDRDQHVSAGANLRVTGKEPLIDDRRRQLNLHAAAVRHPLARVVRHGDENPLDTLDVDVDVEAIHGPRQDQENVIAEHALQDGLHVAQQPLQAERFEIADLLVSVGDELAQETRGPRDVTEQELTLLPQLGIVLEPGEPLPAAGADIAEEGVCLLYTSDAADE